jgi:hypothetical protein
VPPAPLSTQVPQVQPVPVQGDPLLQPPEELPLDPPLDEPAHGQPITHVPLQQHPSALHVMPFGCPEHGLPPLLLPLDPPEELLLEHTHEPHAQLDVHVSVPLHVVVHAIVAPGLQTPPPTQLPHWPDELHVSVPVEQLPQLVVLPTAHCPVQIPETHVWLAVLQSVEVHWPLESHDCALLPEHCVCAGEQTPVQTPPTQVMPLHADGLPHWPLESHDSTPLLEHVVCPGAQTPEHAPEMHVWLVHGCGMPHMPLTHDCTPLPEHCFWPAEQGPVQAPPEHFSPLGHVASVHCPSAVHVCTPVPALSHWVAPGSHTPHLEPEQTEASQGTAGPQLPVESHVSTPPPFGAHSVVPGAQTPVHPATPASFTSHTWEEHAEPTLLHPPDWLQYCGNPPEHRDVPGAQPAWPSFGAGESPPLVPSLPPVVMSCDDASSSGFPSSMPRMAPQPA